MTTLWPHGRRAPPFPRARLVCTIGKPWALARRGPLQFNPSAGDMGIYDRGYYRDEPRSRGGFGSDWSAVTTLMVINVVVWVIDVFLTPQVTADSHWLNDQLAFNPDQVWAHPWRIYTLLTYGFAHADMGRGAVTHILFNMFALWIFGRDVEAIYGKWQFYRVYLSLVITSALGYVLLQHLFHQRAGSLIGASGAIMGITAIYICHYPFRTFLFNFFIPVPAWMLGLFYIYMDFSGTMNPGDNVAHAAHLAGAVFGIVYWRWHWSLASLVPSANWFSVLTRPKMNVYRGQDQDSSGRGDGGPNDNPQDDAELQRRLDQILAKISREGEASLTSEERRTLEEASRRYRHR